MRIRKVFEDNNKSDWEDDFLTLYDSFMELEEQNIGRIDYQAGCSSFYDGEHKSGGFGVFIKDGEILGDKKPINYMLDNTASLPVLRVSIYPIFENENKSPFQSSYSPSFFGKNALIFIKVVKYIESAVKRLEDYDFDITMSNKDDIIVTLILR